MQPQDLLATARTPSERILRIVWMERLVRSTSGVPLLTVDFVSELGRSARIIDVRDEEELTGALGHIPGSAWCHPDKVGVLHQLMEPVTPLVIISRTGEVASTVAMRLEKEGFAFVAALAGGMVAWKNMGFATTRDPGILTRPIKPAEPPAAEPTGVTRLSADQIAAHIGDPQAVRWVKMSAFLAHGKASCVDGRDDHGVIGTPGGDAGEFLLQLAALERVTGKPIPVAKIPSLLAEYMDTFGHFYMHTDITAMNHVIASMRKDPRLSDALAPLDSAPQWRKYMANPPLALREAILEHLVIPEHVGCGHIRLMMQNPDAYGMNKELAQEFFKAFMRMRWDGSVETDFVTLGGGHQEGAVVNIQLASQVHSYTRVPMISPAYGTTQMFVNHPQVSRFMRGQAAHFLTELTHLFPLTAADQFELLSELTSLARQQLGHTLGALAKGLPVYTVEFKDADTFTVHAH